MKILICAATPFEIAPLAEHLERSSKAYEDGLYKYGEHQIRVLITGIGMVSTTYLLTKYFAHFPVDLAVNAGIAGAYPNKFPIGEVVNVVSEQIGDLGAEQADGSFKDVFEMELEDGNKPPFTHNTLVHPLGKETTFLPKAKGLTLNKVTGTTATANALAAKYDPDIESMEGAAFFQVCLEEQINFLQLRAISNIVEDRNKEKWNIPLAINNLNKVLIDLLQSLI